MSWAAYGYSIPAYPVVALSAAILLILLCLAAVAMDIWQRKIPNAFCIAVALLAIPYWFGGAGLQGLQGLAYHLVWPLVFAVPLGILFAFRLLGGGDVKLILAMTLWVDVHDLPALALAIALFGALIAISLKLLNLVFWRIRVSSVPYGLAIVAGGLMLLLPAFAGLVPQTCRVVV